MNNAQPKPTFSAFLPLTLMAVSLIALLAWELSAAIGQRTTAIRIQEQQQVQMVQAVEAERRIKAVMTDLLGLAQTDTNAAAIVRKYRIAVDQPAQPTPAPLPPVGRNAAPLQP